MWVAHWKGWLSEEHLKEANRLFNELVDLFGRAANAKGDERSPHEITFAIAPAMRK